MNKLENPFEQINILFDLLENSIITLIEEIKRKPSSKEYNRPLRLAEAAEYLGVKKNTLYGLVSDRKIIALKPSGHLLFTKEILDNYLNGTKHEIEPTKYIKNKKARS